MARGSVGGGTGVRKAWEKGPKMVSKLPHGSTGFSLAGDPDAALAAAFAAGALPPFGALHAAPEAPNRAHRRIPSTDQHPIGMVTTSSMARGACGWCGALRNAQAMVKSGVEVAVHSSLSASFSERQLAQFHVSVFFLPQIEPAAGFTVAGTAHPTCATSRLAVAAGGGGGTANARRNETTRCERHVSRSQR